MKRWIGLTSAALFGARCCRAAARARARRRHAHRWHWPRADSNAVVTVEGNGSGRWDRAGRSVSVDGDGDPPDGRTFCRASSTAVHLRDYQPPMFRLDGITTIADIHNDTELEHRRARSAPDGNQRPAAFCVGARVTGPNGPPTDGSYVKDAAEARAYVRSLKAAGVDHQGGSDITDEQLQAVIAEADAVGLKPLGHTQNIKKAVDMGMKHMEHMDTLGRALLEQEGKDPRPQGTTLRPR